MDRTVFFLRTTLLLILILGVLIRFTVRDSLIGISTLYYSTPWPVLALVSITAGLLWLRRNRLVAAGLFLVSAVVLCGWFHANIYRTVPPGMVDDSRSISVLFWNISRARLGISRVIDHVKESDTEVIGVVEAGLQSTEAAWKQAFAERHVLPLDGDMLCITKGDVIHKMTGTLAGGGRYNYLRMMLKETPLSLVLVDIDSNPFRSRKPALVELQCVISGHLQENLVIMGDFNMNDKVETPG